MSASKHKKMHSIRLQFAVFYVLLIVGVMVAALIMIRTFLPSYYLKERQRALFTAQEQLNAAILDGTLASGEFDPVLMEMSDRDNISVMIIGADAKTVKSFSSDPDAMQQRMWQNILKITGYSDESGETPVASSAQTVRVIENDRGETLQIVRDPRTKLESMELFGFLDDGSVFLLITALENIRTSSSLALRFFLAVGTAAALIGGVTAFFFAGRMAAPIRKLTEISQRMAKLDFSAHYDGNTRNEIDVLGSNMNDMSGALEHTISELKTANNELENDIREKTEIEEMRKEFISNVTHELKTPIALIQGYAEGLAEDVNDDPQGREEYCSVIIDEADKMNRMVRSLLTLNHLEFGQTQAVMERFDLFDMIDGLLKSSGILAEQEGINVRLTGDRPTYVWADQYLVEDVFNNYYTNAVHYAAGDKVIEIRVEPCGKVVRTTVFNSGNPIPEDAIGHIWEKFYKVDKARTRKYGGSGVGLSIVKASMELMHQAYGVQNFDNGVAFWFELERAES